MTAQDTAAILIHETATQQAARIILSGQSRWSHYPVVVAAALRALEGRR